MPSPNWAISGMLTGRFTGMAISPNNALTAAIPRAVPCCKCQIGGNRETTNQIRIAERTIVTGLPEAMRNSAQWKAIVLGIGGGGKAATTLFRRRYPPTAEGQRSGTSYRAK
jgi:hypothetical protein